jgi:Asp-tRNA(Asn)/Glu-tRNA(Gln) amidotransferase A subunit family amidase
MPVDLPDMAAANAVASTIAAAEAAAYHHDELECWPSRFGPELRSWLKSGRRHSAVDYLRALETRDRLAAELDRALEPVDAIVTPTTPVPATRLGEAPPDHAALRWRNTGPFIVMSVPAISVPCGLTAEGLPIGLQVAGKRFDEAGVLRAAYAYEQATDWHTRRPPWAGA